MKNNYSRRKFMKTVVVSAGAMGAGGMAGCGSDSSKSSEENGPVSLTTPDSFDTLGTTFPQSVASGDPRFKSIILWTRIGGLVGAATVTLQVATDSDFTDGVLETDLETTGSADHCVKVKVTDLSPYTRYYYRFLYEGEASNTGRFKTAPNRTASKDVKFGFVSCQDYSNGYYNSLLKFLESDNDDIDFIVHLGDYVYEVETSNVRDIAFSSDTNSISTSNGNAANTVAQYRDLYKTFRSDEALKKVHERFPFICIWDDHEFSDDCWQNNGTYFNGMTDESSNSRRVNAEQAFFEYMPLDISPDSGGLVSEGQVSVSRSSLYPSNIYRNFRYGQTLDLFMSDYRTYRNDHLIPEDAFPGTVVMTQLATAQTLYSIPGDAFGFKALIDGTLGSEIDDIQNPTGPQAGVLVAVLEGVATAPGTSLPLFPYVDVTSVTEATFLGFIATLNAALNALGQTPISAGASPSFQELMIYVLAAAYQNPSSVSPTLGTADAAAKAVATATGNLDVVSLNGTLESFYEGLTSTINSSSDFLETAITGALTPSVGAGSAAAVAAATVAAIDFTASPPYTAASLEAVLTAVLTPSLGGAAAATAAAVVAGLGVPYADYDAMFAGIKDLLNAATSSTAFDGLDTATAGTAKFFPASSGAGLDTDWGFSNTDGYGVSYAMMGKQNLAGSFGSRYLVVKSTFELFNLYHGLVLETPGYGSAWGDTQQTSLLVGMEISSADWVVLGSSVSFTSLILDASDGGALDAALDAVPVSDDAFPRAAYYMNVDHWDGFPLTRATYMNDSSGSLAENGLGTFQDNNVVIISGDIHAAFVTDHGANGDGGRCLEFTVPAVSSETFGSFTANSIASILGITGVPPLAVPAISGLVDNLGTFLQLGAPTNTIAPQTMNYADPNVNGVGIMELTDSEMTCSLYVLDTTSSAGDGTLLTTNQYAAATTDAEFTTAADDFAASFTTVTRTSTKDGSGNNGALS
ncbi:MAG: alkaline phosphatase D family protein [Pseudomonadales bacterium]|nr:alkaline phosphatase D family protein [Pseudomonadales bacterium]